MSMARHLRDIAFDDLYLHQDIVKSKIRGLDGGQTLSPVPADFLDDLNRLREAVRTGAPDQTPSAVEFSIPFDDTLYRVAVIRDMMGTVYALRRGERNIPGIDSFGIDAAIIDRLMKTRAGMVLVSGAFRAGKTTLASSYALAFSSTGGLVISLEDPPELILSGEHGNGQILQVQIDRGEIEVAVQRTLRTSFDMLFISEIRTALMAAELVSASTNGKLVLSTIHADSAVSALMKLVSLARVHGGDMGDGSAVLQSLAQGLAAILHMSIGKDGKRVVSDILFNNKSVASKLISGSLKSLQEDVNQLRARLANRLPLDF